MQLLSVVGGAELLPKDEVEEGGDGQRDWTRERHEEVGEPDGVRIDRETVPRAYRLWEDLSKDYYRERADCDRDEATANELVEHRGERGVDEHIPQQQLTEEVVAVLPHWTNYLGVLLLEQCA